MDGKLFNYYRLNLEASISIILGGALYENSIQNAKLIRKKALVGQKRRQ